ncbi:MAG: citrate synthase [Candidatus Omnitrophica bacterium]|nr:citrate synthase [Candidatus Omnitrophota bacterium]
MTPTETNPASKTDPSKSLYIKGLEGIVAGQTALSLVDGAGSQLYYRGIKIGELAEKSCFEETVYLLWFGKLPTVEELKIFKKNLATYRKIPDEIITFLKKFPPKAHPMAALRTAVSMLSFYDSDADNITPEILKKKALRLTASFPAILAAMHRIRLGKPVLAPDVKLSHAANYLYMMHGVKPGLENERALDAYLILLADHGFNASTFSARVTCSTESDMYSAVTAAIGTLKGGLHGNANQKAMEMILTIKTPERVAGYIDDLLEHKKKVMGFGHRIYKTQDPRATAFRSMASKLCEKTGKTLWMDISNRVEKVMWEKRQIPCNVDFFSASVLYILGFPTDYFTTVFAASRVAGWTAHVIEQLSDNRLIRPNAEYTGPVNQTYVPINERK